MTIHEADIHDVEVAKQIHALRLASYAIESKLIDYPALPALSEQISDLQKSGERFLVCRDASEAIVGALSFTQSAALLDICSLTVHPDHFGKGIASQLLSVVESLRGETGRMIVSTAKKNVPAVRLYLKHGYALCDQNVLLDGLVLVKLEKRWPLK